MVAKSELHTGVALAFAAKALAYLEAVCTRIDMGLTKVVVKGDSRSVITKCKTSSIDKSWVSDYIIDIQ